MVVHFPLWDQSNCLDLKMCVQIKVWKLDKVNRMELKVDDIVHISIYMIHILYRKYLFSFYYIHLLISFFIIKIQPGSYIASHIGRKGSNENLGVTKIFEHI